MSEPQTTGNNDLSEPSEDHGDGQGRDSKPTIREGLPPTYRMRADAHYVEQLEAPPPAPTIQRLSVALIDAGAEMPADPIPALVESVKRHGVLQPLLVQKRGGATRLIDGRKRLRAAVAAGVSEVPCLIRDIDDRESAALAEGANVLQSKVSVVSPVNAPPTVLDIHDSLARAVADIESCTHLLSSPASSLLESLGTDVIRAEAWRASCLLQASRILQHGVPPGQALCSARRLVTSVAERAESERRLRGYTLQVDHEIPESLMIAGDPRTLGTALAGLLLATCAAMESRSSARISLSASVDATRQIEFAVSQVGSGFSTAWESKVFDPAWNARPGGVSAAVWMLAARTIAESYGGHITVSTAARGTTIRMVMPVAAA